MENKDLNSEQSGQMPGFEDEQYWQRFEQELWTLLRKQKPVSPKKIENCLTFARCGEIADDWETISDSEKSHLDNCRYCHSRVQKFSELQPEAEVLAPSPVRKENFVQKLSKVFSFPPLVKPAFVMSGLLLAAALFGWLIYLSLRQNSLPVDNKAFKNGDTNQSTNAENSAGVNPGALEGVPANEREAVIAALETGKIPLSDELWLFQSAPSARGKDEQIPKPLSPFRRAVAEERPVLSWKGEENTEYVVTVTDRAGREKDNSGRIKGTSWQVSKPLATGLYFWKVAVRKADSEKTVESPAVVFKVISGREKEEIEKIGEKAESRLIKAVIYYRAGLFDEAERQLQTELKNNPDSQLAKSFLQQVSGTIQKIEEQKDQP